jgi:hypothetical protein
MVYPPKINPIGMAYGSQEDEEDGDDQAIGPRKSGWNSLNY